MTAPYRPQKVSILDRLAARLFPATHLLDPAVGQGVGRQGLLQVGTNLLQAGGASPQQPGTLANLGAALGGVDIHELTQQALALQSYQQQQAAQQRVQQVAAETRGITDPRERLLAVIQELVGVPGAEDLIGKLSNVLAQSAPPTRDRGTIRIGLIDPKTRRPVLQGGVPALMRFYEDGREPELLVGAYTPPNQALPGLAQGQRAVLAGLARDALAALDAVGQTAPNLWEQVLSSPIGQAVGGQYGLSEQRQIQNQAGVQFSEAVLRFTTGAAAPESEVRRYLQLVSLRAGDKAGLIARKLAAQRALLQNLEAITQRGDVDPNEAVRLLRQAAVSFGDSVPGPVSPDDGLPDGMPP